MKKMFSGTFIFMVLAIFFFSGSAFGAAIELKFAHFMSPKHIQHRKSFAPFCKKVADLTDGKVNIKIYPGGALGKPKQLPDAAKDGITDIAFIIPAFTTGRFPRMSAMDIPFMAETSVQGAKVIYDLWDKRFSRDFKDYKVLWVHNSPVGHFMTIDKPIHTMEDLKGLKMRSPSAYMSKLFKVVGANPIGMPISKLTMSLQKKVLDGMLTAISAVQDFRLFDLIGHITESTVYVMPMVVVMNKDKWNSLPDYAKKAIDQASGKKMGIHASQVYDDHDMNTKREIIKRGKIKIFKLPSSERQRLIKKVAPLEQEWALDMKKKGFPGYKIIDDVKDSFKRNM